MNQANTSSARERRQAARGKTALSIFALLFGLLVAAPAFALNAIWNTAADVPVTASELHRQWHRNFHAQLRAVRGHEPHGGQQHRGGLHPLGSATGVGLLPQAATGAANTLQIAFTRYLDRDDLTLTVKAADSLLGPWADLAQSAQGGAFVILQPGATAPETGGGNTRTVTVTDIFQVSDPVTSAALH